MKGHNAEVLEHAPGCDGQEYSTCRPVVVEGHASETEAESIEVVAMQWCGECMATFWDVV